MHYKDKNLQIDIRCHTVFMNDQKIELSLKEFTVLKYLTEHPGWVFSHEEIYRNVWKEEPIDCANAVMCCISQLRKKLKVDSRNWNYIRTVRGVGYIHRSDDRLYRRRQHLYGADNKRSYQRYPDLRRPDADRAIENWRTQYE